MTIQRFPDESLEFAFDRVADFLSVHSEGEIDVRALINFGCGLGLDEEGQHLVIDLMKEKMGLCEHQDIGRGVYFGFLMGLLAAEDAQARSSRT